MSVSGCQEQKRTHRGSLRKLAICLCIAPASQRSTVASLSILKIKLLLRGQRCHHQSAVIFYMDDDRRLAKLRKDFGEVFLTALADPETVEICLNADGTLWQERLGEPLRLI